MIVTSNRQEKAHKILEDKPIWREGDGKNNYLGIYFEFYKLKSTASERQRLLLTQDNMQITVLWPLCALPQSNIRISRLGCIKAQHEELGASCTSI